MPGLPAADRAADLARSVHDRRREIRPALHRQAADPAPEGRQPRRAGAPGVSALVSEAGGAQRDAAPLEVAGLRREYGRLVALAGLDVQVSAGECVALVGANGSGKSTAVRAIAGLLEPSAGSVRVCGHDPHREPDAEA